jgi:hypothetical protein
VSKTIGTAGARSIGGGGVDRTTPARLKTAGGGNRRSVNFARTTYREAFGVPYPVPSVEPAFPKFAGQEGSERALGRARPETATVQRTVRPAPQRDPHYPRGA